MDTRCPCDSRAMPRALQKPGSRPKREASSTQFCPDVGNFTSYPHFWIFFTKPVVLLSYVSGERKFFFLDFQRP